MSLFTFDQQESLKGVAPLSFVMRGGVIGGEVLIDYNTPVFIHGQQYLLMFYADVGVPSVVRRVLNGMVVTPASELPLQLFRDTVAPSE